jgi:cytochrome oxidase Cu insertion factor (SCO1/SenC/PrrC family)
VIFFGYTHCPDVSPLTLARLSQARARLGAAAARVRVVFVTLDAERDSAARVQAYTRAFDPTFVALTGSPRALAQVRDAYGAGGWAGVHADGEWLEFRQRGGRALERRQPDDDVRVSDAGDGGDRGRW